AWPEDEMTEVARVGLLRVRDEPVGARPVADGVADRVAEVGRQPAVLDLQHLVPATCLVETERGAVLELRERVLELVAVVEDVAGREDRLQRRIRDAADAAERVRDLAPLRLDPRLVRAILEP